MLCETHAKGCVYFWEQWCTFLPLVKRVEPALDIDRHPHRSRQFYRQYCLRQAILPTALSALREG